MTAFLTSKKDFALYTEEPDISNVVCFFCFCFFFFLRRSLFEKNVWFSLYSYFLMSAKTLYLCILLLMFIVVCDWRKDS